MNKQNFSVAAWRRADRNVSAGMLRSDRPHPLPSPASGRGGMIVALRATALSHRSRGFTLIEMMMVIGLISIVGAIVIGKVYDNFNKGKYGAGKAAVHSMEMKVQAYILDNGSPPQSLNDLITRPGNAPNWTGPYAKPGDLNDPFNHPFQYKAPGEHGDFDIIFLGKDGAPGGDGLNKDVGNWE
jgi:general secretion pathway protein G